MLVCISSSGLIIFLGEESSTFLPIESQILCQYPWSHQERGWDLIADMQLLTQTPFLVLNLILIYIGVEISPGISLEGMMLKLKLQYFGHTCEELTHWKRL